MIDARPVQGDHPDGIQFFSYGGYTPHDIKITGNFIHDDPSTGSVYMQGIFVSDPGTSGFRNIVIDNNLISVGSPNSIALWNGVENVEITNNSLLSWEAGGGGAQIRLVGDNRGTIVENNIARGVSDDNTGADLSNNLVYSDSSSSSLYWGKLFEGTGESWEGFMPKDGSPIDFGSGLGALDRLSELSGDTDVPAPPAPKPEPEPEPTPEPEPEPAPDPDPVDASGVLLERTNRMNFDGTAKSVVVIDHTDSLHTDEATIAFTFNADTVSGNQGLFSKDATNNGDGGHFIARITNGSLYVRFQNENNEKVFTVGGVTANEDHDFAASFGDDGVAVWLDGALVGSSSFSMDWTQNDEVIQIGATGWASKAGGSEFIEPFSGTIENLVVVDQVLDPKGVEAVLEGDDEVEMTSGNDTFIGSDRSDDLNVDAAAGNDKVVAGSGSDVLDGGSGHDTVTGGSGEDSLIGGGGDDQLRGQGGDDWIRGMSGDDVIIGHAGDDRLQGQAGDDTITGGGGRDTFYFNDVIGKGGEERDVISDFNPLQDVLKVDTAGDGGVSVAVSGGNTIVSYADDMKEIVVLGQRLDLDDLTII